MGSYASVEKSRPGPTMKLVAFGTRADSLVIPESPRNENSVPVATTPTTAAGDGGAVAKSWSSFSSAKKSIESSIKENPISGDTPAAGDDTPVKSRRSFSSANKSFGSKEETFFDSQPWLESDDEFHSVNGDFSPSRGNTPKNSCSERLSCVHNILFEERPQSPCPAPLRRRKKLAEFFRDSVGEEQEDSSEDSPENQSEANKKSARSTPYLSGANSNVCSGEFKEKSLRSTRHCLPGFSSCGSFSDKRKKMNTAAIAVK